MNTEKAILATFAYHKIFRFPLNIEELHNFLIYKKLKKTQINKELDHLIKIKKVVNKDIFFELKNSNSYIKLRKEREKYSRYKKMKAKYYCKILSFIPSVKLVAITGALAMNNSTKNDDIDLFIVTSENRLWTTRFLANLLLLPFKRSPNSKKQKNKACLNIFVDESDLSVKDRNIYTAHEIAQMSPIFSKSGTYNKLVKANKWIYGYLPNWKKHSHTEKNNSTLSSSNFLFFEIAESLELILKKMQLNYMKSKRTTETITTTQLFFHPLKTQSKVLQNYKKALLKL